MTAEFTIAVHALVFLYHYKNQEFSSDAIAKNVCVNPARLRKVMATLKTGGLVATHAGVQGGYSYCADEDTSLAEVFDVLHCTASKTSWRSGSDCEKCPIAKGMAPVMDRIYADMDVACRNTLKDITIAQLEKQLCSKVEKK